MRSPLAVNRSRIAAVFALALMMGATLPVPLAAAQDDEYHYLNINQPLVRPGEEATISVSGRPGGVTLRVGRVADPAAVTSYSTAEGIGTLVPLVDETLRLYEEGRGISWGSGSRTLTLDEAGVYYVETQRGATIQRGFIQATTVGFLVKEGPARGLVYAFRLDDGAPIPGARVVANGTEAGATGEDGTLAVHPDLLDGPMLMVAPDGASSVGDLTTRSWYWHRSEESKLLTYFDRPIYRPDQTVYYKSVALELDGDRYVPYNASAVRVKVTTWARGAEEVVHEATLVPGPFGSVAGSFLLREDAPLGGYNVEVTTPDGARGWSSFEVQEYKKPRVKVTTETAHDRYVDGDTVVVRTSAEWFFGAPLVRGAVRYEVTSQEYWDHWGGCRFCRISHHLMPAMDFGYYGGGETVASGTGELRSDGTFAFVLEPDLKTQWPRRFSATVHVTAESGEQQTGTASFTVHPSALEVTLATDAYAYRAGEDVEVVATVTSLEGHPAAGVPVTFVLGQERGDARETQEARTDAHGRATTTFTAATSGGFTVRALAPDARGREASAERWLWIASEHDRYWWGGDRIGLVPEREAYEPGETARVLVLAPRAATVLVTVEGSDLFDWKVVPVDGSAFVEFPTRGAYAPGVSVVATTVRYDPATHSYGPHVDTNEVQLDVRPDPRELSIELLTDKPAYRDGDEARLLVRVKDADGNPVVAEVGLGVVDASIYALSEDRTPNMLEWAYPYARNVRTFFAWQTVGGVRHDYGWGVDDTRVSFFNASTADAAAPEASMDFAAGRTAALKSSIDAGGVKVREVFPDTALWLPFLVTDESGTARVRLTAPDTLTEWRATARAVSRDGLVGEARESFHTRKPLIVELNAPRFLVQGDELSLTAVLHNYVGELRDVEVQLLGVGAVELLDGGYRRVTLSDGDSVRIDFPIRATGDASALANLTVVALTTGSTNESDAYRVKLPVLAHGVLEKAVRAGVDGASFALPVPEGPFAAPPTLTVSLAPGMAGAVLDALPYLLGFPYGCVEQTMSRFMPAVVATRALQDAGYDGVDDPQLPEYVSKGLDRLVRFQHADGGWGWWEHDETHPYMTAYVVAGLAEAKRAGADVDAAVLDRGLTALEKLYAAEGDADMKAYQAYALASAGRPPSSWPAEDAVTLDGLALLGLAKLAAGDRAAAEGIAERLLEAGVREGATLSWTSSGVTQWGRHGIRSDVQLAAHALRLLVATGHDDDAPLVVAWLAEERRGAYWATTKDTAESVLAIVDYLQTADELNPDFEAVVVVDGTEHRVAFRSDGKSAERSKLEVPIPADSAGGEVAIEVAREGRGRLYWTAVLASTPYLDEIPAASTGGLSVTKEIRDDKGNGVSDLVFDEEYVVSVNVNSTRERSYVMLEDRPPAGVEVVRGSTESGSGGRKPGWECCFGIAIDCFGPCGGYGWNYPWANAEIRDDRVVAFATTLPAGESTFTYRVRAVNPGEFHVLPARVEPMYDPGVHASSAETHVKVGAPPRLLLGTALVTLEGVTVRVFPDGPVAAEDVTAALLDEDGLNLTLDAEPEVVPLEDGSLRVTLPAEELPELVTVQVAIRESVSLRRLDTRGAAVTFDGDFAPEAQALWAAGPVVDATAARAQGASAAADPSLFNRAPEPAPVEERPAPTPAPVDEEPPRRGFIPAASVASFAAAVAVAAIAFGRRRER